jgi:VIT1/CCC1 family predicted Fe2+/Mn2+ transporter
MGEQGRPSKMLNPRKFSFGGTSAIVTSMGLIIGLGAAGGGTATIVSALLIAGLADNITDSLSIHMYQESERLEERTALRTTLTNFAVRLLAALSFVAIVLALPAHSAGITALLWGCLLLAAVSYALARERAVRPLVEVAKHLGVAFLVIAASRLIGVWIGRYIR